MNTSASDMPEMLPTETPFVEIGETKVEETPEATASEAVATPTMIATVCSLCNNQLKHCDVCMIGKNNKDEFIIIHPKCLRKGSDVKSLNQIYVHIEQGKEVSSAKRFILQNKVKAIYKAVAKANMQQEAKQG
jgi:hypothetical protein